MKDINELKALFATIQDPEISEETLGAYFEGNLSPDECVEVETAIANSDDLAELVDAVELTGDIDIVPDMFELDDDDLFDSLPDDDIPEVKLEDAPIEEAVAEDGPDQENDDTDHNPDPDPIDPIDEIDPIDDNDDLGDEF